MVDLAAGGCTIYNINVMCKKPLALDNRLLLCQVALLTYLTRLALASLSAQAVWLSVNKRKANEILASF